MKKAIQFAREQCSNFNPNGSCMGIMIADDGSLSSFGAKPQCVLRVNQRCAFFEKCVLPMGFDVSSGSTEQRAASRANSELRDEAGFEYRKLGGVAIKGASGRLCPTCKERELQPRERMCYLCREESRRKTFRKANSSRPKYNS